MSRSIFPANRARRRPKRLMLPIVTDPPYLPLCVRVKNAHVSIPLCLQVPIVCTYYIATT